MFLNINNQHYDKYVEEEFKKLNIRFIGVTDCIDTAIDENKKQHQIMGMTNEWYCEDISKISVLFLKIKLQTGNSLVPLRLSDIRKTQRIRIN